MTEVRSNDYRSAAVRVTEFTLGTKHTNQNVSTTSFTQRPFLQKTGLMGGSWGRARGRFMGGSWGAPGATSDHFGPFRITLRTTLDLRTTSDHYNPMQFISCILITAIVHSFRIHYAELYSTSLTVSELPPTMVRFTCHSFDAVGKLTRKPMIQETCGALCSTGRPRQTDIFWRARKTPMHGAASSGQHHARAQASLAQVPLGAPEDSGAARPRTQ